MERKVNGWVSWLEKGMRSIEEKIIWYVVQIKVESRNLKRNKKLPSGTIWLEAYEYDRKQFPFKIMKK